MGLNLRERDVSLRTLTKFQVRTTCTQCVHREDTMGHILRSKDRLTCDALLKGSWRDGDKKRWTSICCWSRGVNNYKEQQPYWFCQDSIQIGLYTLAAEVCRRTVNTNHLTPNSYINMLCVVWSIQPNVLNWIRPIVNWNIIKLEDMLVVCSSFKKIKPPWSSAMRKMSQRNSASCYTQEDWQLVWWRRWTRLLRCVIVPLHTKKEKCCWSNLRPLTRRISSNTTTFSSSIYSTRYGRGFWTVVGCACVCFCIFFLSYFWGVILLKGKK